MAQFRNITDETLWVLTDQGAVEVEPDSILTVSDDFATEVYFQVGDHGETPLWESIAAPKTSKKSTTIEQPAAAEGEE